MSGKSLELIKSPFFVDFLVPRYPQLAATETVDHMQRTEIEIAYVRDVAALKQRAVDKFYYIIFDETPNSKNVPVLNILCKLVDVTSSHPSNQLAVLSSEEVIRCNAEAVRASVNVAVGTFDLQKVLFTHSSNFSVLY